MPRTLQSPVRGHQATSTSDVVFEATVTVEGQDEVTDGECTFQGHGTTPDKRQEFEFQGTARRRYVDEGSDGQTPFVARTSRQQSLTTPLPSTFPRRGRPINDGTQSAGVFRFYGEARPKDVGAPTDSQGRTTQRTSDTEEAGIFSPPDNIRKRLFQDEITSQSETDGSGVQQRESDQRSSQSGPRPSQSDQRSNRSDRTPSQSDQRPSRSDPRPSQSGQPSSRSDPRPSQSHQRSNRSDRTPSQSDPRSSQSDQRSSQSHQRSSRSDRTPSQSDPRSSQSHQRSSRSDRTPSQSDPRSSQSDQRSSQSHQRSNRSDRTPSQSDLRSSQSNPQPDDQSPDELQQTQSPLSPSRPRSGARAGPGGQPRSQSPSTADEATPAEAPMPGSPTGSQRLARADPRGSATTSAPAPDSNATPSTLPRLRRRVFETPSTSAASDERRVSAPDALQLDSTQHKTPRHKRKRSQSPQTSSRAGTSSGAAESTGNEALDSEMAPDPDHPQAQSEQGTSSDADFEQPEDGARRDEPKTKRPRVSFGPTSSFQSTRQRFAGRLSRQLRGTTKMRVSKTAGVYMEGVLEYLTGEYLNDGREEALRQKRKTIRPEDLRNCLEDDSEMSQVLHDVMLPRSHASMRKTL